MTTRTSTAAKARVLAVASLIAFLASIIVFTPAASAQDSFVRVDTAGDVGRYTSLVLDASDNPVIAYYDRTNGDLKVLHCDDPTCAGTETPTNPDTLGDVGGHTSLVLDAAGNPVIAYHDTTNGDLKVLHCDDTNCTGTETPTNPDTLGDVGTYTSLALDAAGNPVIAYYDMTNADLKVLHCDDPNCTGTETPTSPDTAGRVGTYTSLALDAVGNPVIAYHDMTNNDLKVLHCDDPNCTGTETPATPGSLSHVGLGGEIGDHTSLVLDAAGNPVIAYRANGLRIMHCDDPSCQGTETAIGADARRSVGGHNSLQLDAGGNPVIAYHDDGFEDLHVLHCDDPTCAGTETSTTPDILGRVGRYASLALDAIGNPVVAYWDRTNQDLKLLRCDDARCFTALCERLPVSLDMNAGASGIGTADRDVILGTAGDDVIDGKGGNDIICGAGGDDEIVGGDGHDQIYGGTGNDTLLGGDGDDLIRGNEGQDVIDGQAGKDLLFGGVDADTIDGGEGDDSLRGMGGADTLNGGPGDDFVFGGFGADTINGGAGNDRLHGLIGDDTIHGDDGADTIVGDRGQDVLFGDGDDDVLYGGNGPDTINGGLGDDQLNGGRADDTLDGSDGTDICVGNKNIDTAVNCETEYGIP